MAVGIEGPGVYTRGIHVYRIEILPAHRSWESCCDGNCTNKHLNVSLFRRMLYNKIYFFKKGNEKTAFRIEDIAKDMPVIYIIITINFFTQCWIWIHPPKNTRCAAYKHWTLIPDSNPPTHRNSGNPCFRTWYIYVNKYTLVQYTWLNNLLYIILNVYHTPLVSSRTHCIYLLRADDRSCYSTAPIATTNHYQLSDKHWRII